MAAQRYAIGTVLVQKVYEPNSVPWFKDQMYTVTKFDPAMDQYEVRGTHDNYPRFYNGPQMDITFTVRYTAQGHLRGS